MKVLYFGGQKSGKSLLAEERAKKLAGEKKAIYIATYNNHFNDQEMQHRIEKHQRQRKESFITIEESFNLPKIIKPNETYLIDCLSMWLLNNLERDEEYLLKELDTISKIDAQIVFVLNHVTEGVIPPDKESRKFVDMTGIIGQKIASFSEEVYEVKLGIEVALK